VESAFWDSGVFTAFLCDEKDKYDIPSIAQFLDEAKAGNLRIYASTISSAEVLPKNLVTVGTFEEFLEDYQGAVVAIDPQPNVMSLAGRLRSLPFKKGTSNQRRLSVPDAIILATAIHVRDDYDVALDHFHTFDGGGKKDIEGNRTIPILGFEEWCEDFTPEQMKLAGLVIDLPRKRPLHPAPRLFHGGS
jgi:predicted nucleic acid-binding protein